MRKRTLGFLASLCLVFFGAVAGASAQSAPFGGYGVSVFSVGTRTESKGVELGLIRGPILDKNRFPNERVLATSPKWRADFPYLGSEFEVLAPSTPYEKKPGLKTIRRTPSLIVLGPVKRPARTVYNCIAHSLGIHWGWVNPETGPVNRRLARMDQMYRARRYRRLKTLDFRVETGKEKVVVYAMVVGGKIKQVTHAARQRPDGTWTSKLGAGPLIRHLTPQALNGKTYGVPVAVYVRTREAPKTMDLGSMVRR